MADKLRLCAHCGNKALKSASKYQARCTNPGCELSYGWHRIEWWNARAEPETHVLGVGTLVQGGDIHICEGGFSAPFVGLMDEKKGRIELKFPPDSTGRHSILVKKEPE